MNEVEFTHRGERLRLTRQQVIDALRDQTPQPIHSWWIEVEGRRFPVRQVLACATGISQQDIRVETAMIWLERLGFHIMHVRPRMDRPFTQQTAIDHAVAAAHRLDDRRAMEHRVAALAAAVQLIAGHPDAGIVRAKFSRGPISPPALITIRGFGYRLVSEPTDAAPPADPGASQGDSVRLAASERAAP